MVRFMYKCFSKFQCGFRKGCSTQQCLIALSEKWKKAINSGKSFTALLTELSKAFDYLPHELLLAKSSAYGFSLSAMILICSYLFNRQQRTKTNTSYSPWEEILLEVPQRSILSPLVFNIFNVRPVYYFRRNWLCYLRRLQYTLYLKVLMTT